MKSRVYPLLVAVLVLFLLAPLPAQAQRRTVSLDGTWRIADSRSEMAMPGVFDHAVQVPGLVNLAQPAFPDSRWLSSAGNTLLTGFGQNSPRRNG